MKYEKVICVDKEYYNCLTLYKKYTAVMGDILFIYDNEKPLGFYPSRMFEKVEKIRKKRLKSILNEI